MVTGLAVGLATITATIAATSERKSGAAAITVTQTPRVAVAFVSVSPTTRSVTTRQTVQLTPPAPTGGMWPNEPAGWRSVTDYAFNDAIPTGRDVRISGGWSVVNGAGRITRITDGTAPVSPSSVARIFYPRGFGAGSEPGTLYYPQSGTKDHYVGYAFKLSKPYSNNSVGTKQWYPYSATGNYFMMFASDSKMWMVVQADGSHGGAYNLSGNASNPTITLGVWHRIEVLQRYPTSSSSKDGIFRWWIDGVLCGNYTNIGWNTSSTYQELRFAPTWGGMGGSVAFDTDWQIDHVKISRP